MEKEILTRKCDADKMSLCEYTKFSAHSIFIYTLLHNVLTTKQTVNSRYTYLYICILIKKKKNIHTYKMIYGLWSDDEL